MEIEIQLKERVHELTAKKKKLTTSMKRAKRTFIKAKTERVKVDGDLKKLKAHQAALAKMTPEEKRKAVLEEMADVTPEDIYPKDLERDFERIDKKGKRVKPAAEKDVLDLAIEDDDEDGDIAGTGGGPMHVGDDEGRTMAAAAVRGGDVEEEEDEVIDLSNE